MLNPLVGSYPTLSPLTSSHRKDALAGLLSVAVVVAEPLPTLRPHLLFRGAIASVTPIGSREVPLPTIVGSDDTVAPNLPVY
ncbi:MAG: hypothetical protein BroJett021_19290 [Chloroflexota bacterium]|nr:MAG: hypothetical protein BroJett021_19290 [Chloroflexota bacterium]